MYKILKKESPYVKINPNTYLMGYLIIKVYGLIFRWIH